MVSLHNDWDALLEAEFKKDYYLSLREFLKKEYFSRKILKLLFFHLISFSIGSSFPH